MIPTANVGGSLAISGKGEAEKPEPDLFEPRIRTTVRYADPAAWVTAAAVARAMAPLKDRLTSLRDHIGVVITSDEGPKETMQIVADAAVAGWSSPMRFPAANPGSLAGVSCIAFGFRGPTLNIILPSTRGVPLGLLVANGWLQRRVASYVVLASCGCRASGALLARCLLLSLADSSSASGSYFDEGDAAWLISNPT